MTTTARDLCTDSLKEAGVLGVGQTALATDINDANTRLQRMMAVWQKQRWLVPSLDDKTLTLDGSKSYTVGVGGDINVSSPPSDIKGGYIIQLNTGQTPVSLPLRKIFSYEDYIQIALKDLTSLPTRFFYDNKFPLANVFPWPIGNSQYEAHFLLQSRIGFGSTIETGQILTAGTGGVDGQYNTVEIIGGIGTGATADITVTGGEVTLIAIASGGQDFATGNILTIDTAAIGGVVGFTYEVLKITSDLDTVINLPEEYEEAIMYNLTLRVCSMYQVEPMAETRRLAKSGLNIIRKNNTQVPTLTMPVAPGLRGGRAFNIYNPDGY